MFDLWVNSEGFEGEKSKEVSEKREGEEQRERKLLVSTIASVDSNENELLLGFESVLRATSVRL